MSKKHKKTTKDLTEFYNIVFQSLPGIAKKHIEQIEPGISLWFVLEKISVNPVKFNGSIEVNGEIITRELYRAFIPPPGALINIILIPTGGGGGGGKDPMKMILSIAILAASGSIASGLGLAKGTFGFSIGRALIAAVGMSALVRPQTQAAPTSMDSSRDPRTHTITGSSNKFNPYGVFPRLYGTHLIYPDKAGEYTEIIGNDLYYRAVFNLGYGRLDLTSLKIGNNGIAEYQNNTPYQKKVNTLMNFAAGYVTETTESNVDRFTAKVIFKSGLITGLDSWYTRGSGVPTVVEFTIQYAVKDSGSWVSLDTAWIVRGRQRGEMIVSYEYVIGTVGQYDVRIKRNTADSSRVLRCCLFLGA